MDHGKSNPNAGSSFVGKKKGIVPKPKGDYLQAGVESEKNKIEKIAAAPEVCDREHAEAKAETDTLNKSAAHAHTYPGRKYPEKGTHTGH